MDGQIVQKKPVAHNGNGNVNGKPGQAVLSLMICKGYSGQVCRVSVPAHGSVMETLSAIADQIGYESPDYEKIGLYNLTQDFEYGSLDRLDESGTRNGDLLIMADGEVCHKD